MRAFVTGATGFIGGHVARRLAQEGHEVTALARSPERTSGLRDAGVAIVKGDVTEPQSLLGPIRRADAVFHIAAWYQLGASDRTRMYQINVKGTENVIRAATDAGVERVVYCSSVAVLGTHAPGEVPDETATHDGRYGSMYEETKWMAHQRVHALTAEGAPVVTVMPGAVYGLGDASILGVLLRFYAKGWLVALPFQDAGVSWVRVEDVADGIIAAHDKGRIGEDYILAGDNVKIGDLLRRIAPITGIRAPRLKLSNRLVRLSLPLSPLVSRIIRQPAGIVREGLDSLSGSIEFSSEKARRELGYTFRSVEEGMPEVVQWYRENT